MGRIQFEEITVHANNNIDEITGIKNIAEHTNIYYYIAQEGGSGIPIMKASSSFGSDDVNKDEQSGTPHIFSNYVTRQFGTNIYGLQLSAANLGDAPLIVKYKSTDSGSNFNHNITAGAASNDEIIAVDATELGGVGWWIIVFFDNGPGTSTIKAYNYDGSSIIVGNLIKNKNASYAGGLNSDGDYEYLEFGSDDKFYQVIFDGSTFSRTEIIDELVAPDTWDLSRQLYWDIRGKSIILTGNQMFQKINGKWTLISVASEQNVIGVIWKKDVSDEYDFDYIIWNNHLYYINPGGSLFRIQELSVDARVGYDDWFSSGSGIYQKFEDLTFDGSNIKLPEAQLQSSTLSLISPSQQFSQGGGIILTNVNSVEVFVGNVTEIITDLDGQKVFFDTPAKDDLEREITVSYINKKVSEIFQDILDNHCLFLNGTISATTDEYTISWQNTKIKEILKWGQEREFKIFYWDYIGDSTLDNGSIGTIVLDENSGDMDEIKITDLGKELNGVLLRGGMIEGRLARLFVSDAKPTATQLNFFIVDVPQMIDDEDLPGHEMFDYGTKLLANRASAFRNIKMTIFEKGKPQIGQKADLTSQSYGITNINFIFFQFIYFPEEDNTSIQRSYNGLYFIIDSEKTLSESNREILGQVVEELNNISQIGSIFYLDSNASDVAGYKKMLSVYAGAIEENISIVGAVDGDPIEEFITEPGVPGITEFIGGIYSIHIHASKTTGIGTKDVAIYFEIYKYALDTTETLLGTASHPTDKFEGNNNLLETHVHIEDEMILATDRILVKFYVSVTGNGAAPSIELSIQGDTTSRFVFPFNIPSSSITDPNAVHVNVANEITAIAAKSTLVSADEMLLEDSAAGFVKKAVTFANFKTSLAIHPRYTNAEALAIVNATGLALANTKVITSQDADLTFTFGRTQIDSRFSDMMTISHRDMSGQDEYAFGQTSSGSTYINAPTGQLIHLHINDIMKMSLSSGSLSMGIPIAMGANKITGLANAVAATDAMAFGQKGASQLSELSDVDSDLSTVIKSMETTGSGSYPASPKEGQIYYDNDEEMMLRWNNTAGAWIEFGGGAGLVGGNSLYALLTEALLLTGGAVSGAITGSHGHTTLIGQEIQQLSMVGTNGFTESVYWGASQAVPMSDSSADLYMAFSIPIAGTYTLKFLHAKTSATGHDTITYRKYIGEVTPPEVISWNIRNNVGDTAIAVTHGIIYISIVETGIVLASNSFLAFRIHKNANEVDGNWHVYGGILERTA